MKVLIDHQAFSMQKYGGISRIFAELIKGLEDKFYPKNLLIIITQFAYLMRHF